MAPKLSDVEDITKAWRSGEVTLRQLEEESGVDHSTIAKWADGVQPIYSNFAKVAEALSRIRDNREEESSAQ